MPPGAPDLLDRIRARCTEVAATARHVHLVEARLPGYAAELCGPTDELVPGDPAHADVAEDTETRCLFVLALDAVNFGSGWFPVMAKRRRAGRPVSGYHTVAGGLVDHVRAEGLTVADLRTVDRARMAAITGQDPAGPVRDLLEFFVRSWRGLGELLAEQGDGSAVGFVDAAGGSAARLVAMLDKGHPLYRDAPDHRGVPVPLYKRAQITAADLHRAFAGEGPGRFEDLDRLTLFADNLVPHVLRLDGLLRFSDDLVARIDVGELLVPGSEQEVEIRAVAVHAGERLVAEMARAGHPVTAMTLDGLLWHRGGSDRYKARPRHRCRTTAY